MTSRSIGHGRMPTVVATAAMALILMLSGCGQRPATVSLAHADTTAALPAACLGEGLDVALGLGAYAVPLSGSTADADELPAWESAALQQAGARAAASDGPLTLCAYIADHPSPFTTRGGEDAVVCVAVDRSGRAELVGVRLVATGDEATACVASDAGE